MRFRAFLPAGALALALAGCSAADYGSNATTSVTEDAASADAADARAKDGVGAEAVKVSLPKLAYSYELSYRLPSDKLGGAQDAHRRLCENMGPARCQLLSLTRGDAENSSGDATLKVRVATAEAQGFADAASKAVSDAGGRTLQTNVGAEDVSKQVVDTEARIRQREMLVARLTDVLRRRNGKVEELVAAERSVAEAQEELDQARGWLAELKGRVAMSDVEIRYEAVAPATSPSSTTAQLNDAVTGSATGFAIGLQMLVTLAIYILPWALLVGLAALGIRAVRRRVGPRIGAEG
ncbi:DUF4349 domain-containing protein [Sphingomonas sp.]|uniref:DUF4349 domain-containing protein n=1 Tax=Sphingomonas sp. TaxID=28214 RepID=UPI001B24D596|nr:DUF4349 domain-containing protein [Sphingomonas sp.]MBO9712774.1 DUF4349 domain-containing protein [Sphingomonas sp.]